jgi:predicted patatin/cPLA2 family phospholipase
LTSSRARFEADANISRPEKIPERLSKEGESLKTGIIDAGGGLRGVFGAGVCDYCLEHNISFGEYIGVSAGSANGICFLAGQKGRNVAFYTVYPFRRKYMSLRNLIFHGSYLDLDYIYGTLSNSDGENPLDYDALRKNPAELAVVSTEAETGRPKYFTKDDVAQDHYEILCASSCIPAVCRPYELGGVKYYDGALSDPVPLKKALDDGCGKVVVILTKPRGLVRTSASDERLARRISRRYPKAAQMLCNRAALYNESVAFAKQMEKEGKALILSPDSLPAMGSLTKDKDALMKMYRCGMESAAAIPAFLGAENTAQA